MFATIHQSKHGNITKLNYINYDSWKMALESILEAIDAFDIVNGDESSPDGLNSHKPQKDCRKRAGAAHVTIILSCKSEIKKYIKNLKPAKEMWHDAVHC
jgi:hypothetical protein